jgi:phenylacetate-CoA ligase
MTSLQAKKMNIGRLFGIGKAAWNGFKSSNVVYKSSDYIKQFENRAIQKAVSTAYNETDFYREKYDEYGVHPRDIRTAGDLAKLPIITKNDLINNFEGLIPRTLDMSRAYLQRTSGSTGRPIQVYEDGGWLASVIASMLRMLKIHKAGMPRLLAIFDRTPNNFETSIQGYLKRIGRRVEIVSVEQEVSKIMEKVERNNPEYIVTYTGVMRSLAILKNNGAGKNLNIKKVLLTGEILDDYTRKYIEEAFDCLCYSLYGSTEGGITAWECPNKKMHIQSDHATVEIVDHEGNPLPPGEDGRILVTRHDGGKGVPIIRYSGLADVGHLLEESCGCGMNTPILGPIQGRTVDSIHLPDGRIYHAFSMTIPMEKIQRQYEKECAYRYQIVQHKLNQITISLLPNDNLKPCAVPASLIETIERTYRDIFGPDVGLVVQEVQSLPKGSNVGMPTPLVKCDLPVEAIGRMRF